MRRRRPRRRREARGRVFLLLRPPPPGVVAPIRYRSRMEATAPAAGARCCDFQRCASFRAARGGRDALGEGPNHCYDLLQYYTNYCDEPRIIAIIRGGVPIRLMIYCNNTRIIAMIRGRPRDLLDFPKKNPKNRRPDWYLIPMRNEHYASPAVQSALLHWCDLSLGGWGFNGCNK